MASGGKKVCRRSGKTIYPADKYEGPIQGIITGKRENEQLYYLKAHFTCASTGTKLTMKTYVQQDGDVYLKGKEPGFAEGNRFGQKPNQVSDVITDRVAAVPDANMRSTDRMFNVAGKQAHRGTGGEDLGSGYGVEAVAVVTQTSVSDSNMRTTDRKLNIAGTGETRHAKDEHQGSNYGMDGQIVQRVVNVVKPATWVQNANQLERRHNGSDLYRGTEDGDAAE